MTSYLIISTFFIILISCNAYQLRNTNNNRVSSSKLFSDNTDMFGSSSTSSSDKKEALDAVNDMKPGEFAISTGKDKLEDEAAKLRREAAEMELALREEARAKGLPQEVIDKLVPIRGMAKKASKPTNPDGTVLDEVKEFTQTLSPTEVRKKLGYLNAGDPVRFTSELDRLKSNDVIGLWNSEIQTTNSFSVNNYQMKSKTGIEPVDLRLDDVGFEYQKVFFIALGLGSVFGLSASAVGGELGFLLGYASALFPILLVGVGSIAPGLIGDFLNRAKFIYDEESRERAVRKEAAKFLVGYAVGLPVAQFKNGSPTAESEFFQLRPRGKSEADDRKYFQQTSRSQKDIARASVTCVAGSVGECIQFKVASGTSANDVNTLYELMNAVDPKLAPESVQNHIRWSVVEAYKILDSNKEKYEKLCEAFKGGEALEECISIIEGI